MSNIFNAPYSKPSHDEAKLNAQRDAITSVHVIENIGSTDDESEILSTLSIASDTMTAGDKSVQLIDGKLHLVLAAKTNLLKTGSSEQYHTGTATAGSINTLTETGANFTDLENKVVQITSGANNGKWAKIVSHTSTVLTFKNDAFESALDSTTEYVVRDDLTVAFFNANDEIELVFEEPSDKIITSDAGDTVSTPAYSLPVPTYTSQAV